MLILQLEDGRMKKLTINDKYLVGIVSEIARLTNTDVDAVLDLAIRSYASALIQVIENEQNKEEN